MSLWKKIYPGVLLIFVNMLNFSFLIPILPNIVSEAMGGSHGLLYGLLLASYSIMQFFATPILGSLSDRMGRRRLLILSQAGTTLSWLLFGAAYYLQGVVLWQIPMVLVMVGLSRIADGITGGNNSIANAWISDRVEPEERSQAFAYAGAALGVAISFGPLLGGLSYETSLGLLGTAIVAFCISLLALIGVAWKLPETLPPNDRETRPIKLRQELNLIAQIKALSFDRHTNFIVFARVCYSFGFVAFTTSVTLLLEAVYQLSAARIGLIMSLIGAFAIFNQAFVVERLSKRFQLVPAFFLGLFFVFLSLGLTPIFVYLSGQQMLSVFGLLMIGLFYVLNLGSAMAQTLFKTIVTDRASRQQQGLATGVNESISAMGRALVPAFSGLFFDLLSYWVFFLYAGVVLVPLLIQGFFFSLDGKHQNDRE